MRFRPLPLFFLTFSIFAFPASSLAGEPAGGDRAVLATAETLYTGPLPRGPVAETVTLDAAVDALAYAPDGRLLGVRQVEGGPSEVETTLVEVGDDGRLTVLGEVVLEPQESPLDLAFDHRGRLYLLTEWLVFWNPPDARPRLHELDPNTGDVLDSVELFTNLWAAAPAPDGLWLVGDTRLYRYLTANGTLLETGIRGPDPRGTFAADVDSSGAVWVLSSDQLVTPPIQRLRLIDPGSGTSRWASIAVPIGSRAFAIDRRCVESATARCLQGGRFRAEVTWRTPDGTSGPGRAAPVRSAETAIFWFFSPANWEFLIKVLDGCDENGHFWVFASAATDVAYELRVTDLETGEERVFDNPGGQAASAITATTAFETCP